MPNVWYVLDTHQTLQMLLAVSHRKLFWGHYCFNLYQLITYQNVFHPCVACLLMIA